ncbi:MAG: hypothetical protein P1U34_03380 [Coxiellaceae bacterium]|nr:hypothetical protein [Coxiellaceae bacterium]
MRLHEDSAPTGVTAEQLAKINEITKDWPNKWHLNTLNSKQRIDSFLTIDPKHHQWLSQLKPAEFAFVIGSTLSNINNLLNAYHHPALKPLTKEQDIYATLLHLDLSDALHHYFPDEVDTIDATIGRDADSLYTSEHYDRLDITLSNLRRLHTAVALQQRVNQANTRSNGMLFMCRPTGTNNLAGPLAGKVEALLADQSFTAMNSPDFTQLLTETEELLYNTADKQLNTELSSIPGARRAVPIQKLYEDIRDEYEPWYGKEARDKAKTGWEEEKAICDAPGPR